MKTQFKKGDAVKIISAPIVENNEYGQSTINQTVGKKGIIDTVYLNGNRNIYVKFMNYDYNYYNAENIKHLSDVETLQEKDIENIKRHGISNNL